MSLATRRHKVRGAYRKDPVTRKTDSYRRELRGAGYTIDNGPPEIPCVCPEQIAMALALFRAAVLDETVEEAILPLSDRGI
jgi:hypothetical protein